MSKKKDKRAVIANRLLKFIPDLHGPVTSGPIVCSLHRIPIKKDLDTGRLFCPICRVNKLIQEDQ